MDIISKDNYRYGDKGKMSKMQYCFRKAQLLPKMSLGGRFYRLAYKVLSRINHVELSVETHIGEGLYIGHGYCITINTKSIIGRNVNIHKGVTIGQENRGKRIGAPTIGDYVWIGVNSTIVGNVTIGNDVLIAPNTFVNCDVPPHSIVLGNPCIIKHCMNDTDSYITCPIKL